MKRFFECLAPVTVCNLRCPYCYIIQENRRTNQFFKFKYPVEDMIKGLSVDRLGGKCWFSICGAGETLFQEELVELVQGLLNHGHFVNITTNGTLTSKFDLIIEKCKENIKQLHISFSLHYVELKRLGLLDVYFENVIKMKKAGASILVQFNLCDEYMPYLEEIKQICLEKVGAYPQVALTRDESSMPMKIHSSLSNEEYYEKGKEFESPLFEFTKKNFNQKRKEFCYAGDWSGTLNLKTGILSKCYANIEGQQNIFEDISKEINFEAIGNNCKSCYCVNSSHFMSLGVIPSLETPSYTELRNRPQANWHSQEMIDFLSERLYETNEEYSSFTKNKINKKYKKNRITFFKKVKIKLGLMFKKKNKG